MGELSERDLRAILDFVGEANDAQDRSEFRALVLPGLQRLVPSDYASYNEFADGGQPLAAIVEPQLPEWAYSAWPRFAPQNPLLQHFQRRRDGRARRFSDVISREELRRSAIFRDFLRPLGLEHQLAFMLPSDPRLTIGIALSRGGRDFSERQRALVNLTRPHLIQAYRNAELRERLTDLVQRLESGLDAAGGAMILLDRRGAVELASPQAKDLVREVSGESVRAGAPPPDPFASCAEANRPSVIPLPRQPDSLLLRVVRVDGDSRVIVMERAGRRLSEQALSGLGLTPREAQVLRALACGLSPAAAAAELGISRRTLAKHQQHINAKLGVKDRGQAIAVAWASVGAQLGEGDEDRPQEVAG